ncbi:unnamed protein product [Rotaria socialis]|uniref:Sugar phosphate transporter domain-containing protein n=3 Tax=Rotaria socialis TaxID=392032 RepID=A0A820MHT0_9BILA|nr:unnamed protein product [Rotaria socialis]CAF3446204.1 unnamed protein product [Rotaria socialis]CAF3446813.1 unnamed protein product [Rotaria socialis]CAF3654828.1 unnamed protein product [Rotaria socialis]CAF4263279.1 unnamed protein product [Rotaria socialis]
MTYSYATQDHRSIDNKDESVRLSLNYSNDDLSASSKTPDISSTELLVSNSSILNDQNPVSNPRIAKSCFLSTFIFLINFISSILVINLSKWIYVKHHFPNLTLTTMNFFITFLLLLVCLQLKLFAHVRLPIPSMIPVSICFGGFIAFSNLSLQYNTVGTYQLIKLQVTPTVMLVSWLFFKAHYPLPIVFSFMPVFVGTLISTYYDLQFNTFGLFCALMSVLFTAMYQILVEHSQNVHSCNALQLLLYQAPLSGLLLLCFVPFFEPLNDLEKFMNYDTILLILLCGFIAFFVNLTIFWVIGNLSPVAYNMIGHTKTLLIILVGSIIFHEALNIKQIFGLGFTMFGVFIYTYFKYIRKPTK